MAISEIIFGRKLVNWEQDGNLTAATYSPLFYMFSKPWLSDRTMIFIQSNLSLQLIVLKSFSCKINVHEKV